MVSATPPPPFQFNDIYDVQQGLVETLGLGLALALA